MLYYNSFQGLRDQLCVRQPFLAEGVPRSITLADNLQQLFAHRRYDYAFVALGHPLLGPPEIFADPERARLPFMVTTRELCHGAFPPTTRLAVLGPMPQHFNTPSGDFAQHAYNCLLYTSPSPRDGLLSRMPSSA